MGPKFINSVPSDALGLNGTRLYADTVLTLIGVTVFELCLLMAVNVHRKSHSNICGLNLSTLCLRMTWNQKELGYKQTLS